MIFVPYRLLPNSWHTFSPDAGICSPMGTRVSVFRGKKIKKNNSKELKQHSLPTPKTPNNVTLPKWSLDRKHSGKHKSSSAPLFLSSWAGEVENLPFSLWVDSHLRDPWDPCCGEFLLFWPLLLFAGYSHGLGFLLGFGFPSLLLNQFMLLIQNLPVEFRTSSIYIW